MVWPTLTWIQPPVVPVTDDPTVEQLMGFIKDCIDALALVSGSHWEVKASDLVTNKYLVLGPKAGGDAAAASYRILVGAGRQPAGGACRAPFHAAPLATKLYFCFSPNAGGTTPEQDWVLSGGPWPSSVSSLLIPMCNSSTFLNAVFGNVSATDADGALCINFASGTPTPGAAACGMGIIFGRLLDHKDGTLKPWFSLWPCDASAPWASEGSTTIAPWPVSPGADTGPTLVTNGKSGYFDGTEIMWTGRLENSFPTAATGAYATGSPTAALLRSIALAGGIWPPVSAWSGVWEYEGTLRQLRYGPRGLNRMMMLDGSSAVIARAISPGVNNSAYIAALWFDNVA